jgi:prevent-host-death family protein
MRSKTTVQKKPALGMTPGNGMKQMAAAEFKAKCLGLIDDVSETGHEVIITKRGEPKAKLVPFSAPTKRPFLGRLEGIMEIVGDPDDLIKPVFPLEDYDMLK